MVLGQQVHAEVALEVPPHGVDVVRAVLRAVVLDQERRALHPVVVRKAALQPAHPRECDRVESGPADLLHALAGDRPRHHRRVLLDQRQEHPPLGGGHRRPREAAVLLHGRLARVARQDVAGRRRAQHGPPALRRVERLDERPAEVLLGRQHARAFLGPLAHLRGVAPHELRRRRQRPPCDDRPVKREVVALVAPAPRPGRRGVAEDRHVVQLEVASDGIALDHRQHRLEHPDGLGFRVALLAQTGLEKRARRVPLGAGHPLERQPRPLARDEEPAEALLGVEGQPRDPRLALVQRREEGARRPRHVRGRRLGGCRRHGGGHQDERHAGESAELSHPRIVQRRGDPRYRPM